MKLNDYYNAKTVIFYDNENETEKTLNPYQVRAYFDTTNILGESVQTYDDYFGMNIPELIPANARQVNSSKRRGDAFIHLQPGTLEGVLYLPMRYVKEWRQVEEKREQRGGCVAVSYNDFIIFKDNILQVRDSFHDFKKGTDPISNRFGEDVKPIGEKIAELETGPVWFKNEQTKERRRRLIELYKQKQAEGFEYVVWCYRAIKTTTNELHIENCIDHYEKKPEYIKAEKLTEKLAKINSRWGINDTLDLLQCFNISEKRTKKGAANHGTK